MDYRKTAAVFETAANIAANRGDFAAADLHILRANHFMEAACRERFESPVYKLVTALSVIGLATIAWWAVRAVALSL